MIACAPSPHPNTFYILAAKKNNSVEGTVRTQGWRNLLAFL